LPDKIRFGVYELDRDAMELRKHGVPLRLQDQPLRVLAMLAGRPGEIVTREELQEQIWGNTFVDFDQSLNKAINRIREALNDNAGTPQYVETVPRRGYRFIAPVAPVTPTAEQLPAAPLNAVPAVELPQSRPDRATSRIVIVAALAIVGVLAAIGVAAAVWLRQAKKPTLPEARLMSSSGYSPALSRDGKLLAYVSVPSDGERHIMVQQTAGGEAVPVTFGPSADESPDFSPDGTSIAFYSARNRGGIYIVPTLHGEPRLIAATPEMQRLRFSPSGDRILYTLDQKVFTVSVDGGQPFSLPLNQDFRVYGPSTWSPDGTRILFYGVRGSEPNNPTWWIVPLTTGKPTPVRLPGVERNYQPETAVRAWVRAAGEQEWIVYASASRESWKLWRVGVSSDGATNENPELPASGVGTLEDASVSGDGKVAYGLVEFSASIHQVSMDSRGQKSGPTLELPLPQGGSHLFPSVSRDGKWMAYNTHTAGDHPYTVRLRDLTTGADHFLADQGRSGVNLEISLSPDGSHAIFNRDCKTGGWIGGPETPLPCGFMVTPGGEPEQICERCTPRGFSSDGSVLLIQKYDQADPGKTRIAAVDLRSKTEREFLRLPDRPLFHPFFSWDDKWVVFKKISSNLLPPSQILIAPMRNGSPAGQPEWIAVTDGQHSDDKPQFSADGNTVYFTSTRDGFLCIWAQRLDPVTRHPLGSPVAYEHFHDAAGRAGVAIQDYQELSVARDKMLIGLPEVHSNIWMTQMP
jgi:DNA-binding winged helix-turn-helix (wHTH) protein/Tol biopolymer transport system component